MEKDVIYNVDCLIGMRDIPDNSIDMILCDLPYGKTGRSWDTMIPFEPLWEQYKRIIKDNRAIVLFGKEPFSSKLRLSNEEWFKYDIIWDQNAVTGFTNAKLKPLTRHEVISVFSNGVTANGSKNNMIYNPQGLIRIDKVNSTHRKEGLNSYERECLHRTPTRIQEYTNYPTTIVKFSREKHFIHPTQKPLALLEYLIQTYSNEGELILDNCMGSGSTAIAALKTNRHFIGYELEEEYYNLTIQRILNYETERMEARD